jgi:hypothetical protein
LHTSLASDFGGHRPATHGRSDYHGRELILCGEHIFLQALQLLEHITL